MRNIPLEVPLRALALARCRKCRNAADAWIESLRDPFDGAALSGRVASFEEDNHLEIVRHDPVLQLDQFALQPEKLHEVDPPVQGSVRRLPLGGNVHEQFIDPIVIKLHFELFVVAVDQILACTFCKRLPCRDLAHGLGRARRCALRDLFSGRFRRCFFRDRLNGRLRSCFFCDRRYGRLRSCLLRDGSDFARR